MKFEGDDNTKQLTGLFFTSLVIVFLFSSSYSFANSIQKPVKGQLTVQTSPTAQIIFSNAGTASESIFQCISKFQIADAILSVVNFDIISREVTNSDALFITPSLYNTFYTHLSAKAP